MIDYKKAFVDTAPFIYFIELEQNIKVLRLWMLFS